jgi:HSP20 family protein
MVVSLASHSSRFHTMTRQMLHWMDQVLSPGSSRGGPPGTWAPSVNLYEDAGGFYAVADLAGVDPKEMELRVEKDVLVLVGQRETPQPPDPHDTVCLHLMEIDHGAFSRTINLPPGVDASRIEAAYRNGLLWVRIPRKAK